MADIPSRSFVSNPTWFCKNDTDLLKFFNKIFPLPKQASWTIFSPSSTVSIHVIYVLRMKHLEMGKWLQLKKSGKHAGKLVLFCQTLGSGALDTVCCVPAESLVPHRIFSLHTLRMLWLSQTSRNWNSVWGALGC